MPAPSVVVVGLSVLHLTFLSVGGFGGHSWIPSRSLFLFFAIGNVLVALTTPTNTWFKITYKIKLNYSTNKLYHLQQLWFLRSDPDIRSSSS